MNKIRLLKRLREKTGLGLKDAKDIIDDLFECVDGDNKLTPQYVDMIVENHNHLQALARDINDVERQLKRLTSKMKLLTSHIRNGRSLIIENESM